MADKAPRSLVCLIEGESKTFGVKPTGELDMTDLKDLIKEKRKNGLLSNVDAADLTLWKVDFDPSSIAEEELENLAGKNVQGSMKIKKPLDTISRHWPATALPNSEHIHLIIELPSEPAAPFLLSETLPAGTPDLWPEVTFNAPAQGNFGGVDNLGPNRISELSGDEPDFLKEFRTQLRQTRWIESDTNPVVLLVKDKLHEFDNYFQCAPPTGVEQSDRFSSDGELYHLAGAFLFNGWKKGYVVKEEDVRWIFAELALHFHSVFGSRARDAFLANWPFGLIVSVQSDQKKYRYNPRSDFHVSVDRLVYLMVEVQSERNEGDRFRMLFQAACAARLGRRILTKPFIVVALYIANSGRVTQYFVFKNGDRVSYVSCTRDWTEPSQLFTAMFEIYNLVSIIRRDRPEPSGTHDLIDSLNSHLEKDFKETFMSKRTRNDNGEGGAKPPKRPRESHGNQGGSTDDGERVYHDRQVIDAFRRAGYTLRSDDEDEDGWAPLNRLKPTMRRAVQSKGTEVVLKPLYPSSHELQILQHLHSIKSPYNHTIPLFAALEMNVGTFIVLPDATPLDIGFKYGMFHNNALDFSRQLVEGVAFLHFHGIAHLDIKPQNIVALRNQLFIIDFDISVRVDGPDALIDRWCGTPNWMAPEIQYRPNCLYSPIRADLWSCGRVLQYLASKSAVENRQLKALIWRLLNKNPRLRPLLHLQLSEQQDGLKRKPDALPQSDWPLVQHS